MGPNTKQYVISTCDPKFIGSKNTNIYKFSHYWWTITLEQGCYSAKTKIGAKKYYKNRCKIGAN